MGRLGISSTPTVAERADVKSAPAANVKAAAGVASTGSVVASIGDEAPCSPRPRGLDSWLRILCIMLGVSATAVLCRALARCFPALGAWGLHEAAGAGMLLLILLVVTRHERNWNASLKRLQRIVHDISCGAAPIDDLKTVRGSMTPVAAEIARLMRAVRLHEASMAQLNDELQQRVASRTSALQRLLESTRYQSERDPLTGMLNRRALDQHLDRLTSRCAHGEASLAVLAIDVDNFKMLNDTLGHAVGDQYLRDVGQLLRSALRENDLAFRTGGDEFLILLPAAGKAACASLAERLQTLSDSLAATLKVSPKPRLSIGAAMIDAGVAQSGDALLARADEDLYRLKAQRQAAGERLVRAGA